MILKSTHENNAAQSSTFHMFLFKRTLFRIIFLLLVCIAAMTKPVLAQGTSYTYYFDGDGDGYGKSNSAITSDDPTPPPDYASQDGDCNDGDKSVHPNAEEICGDGIDNNCNGQTDEGCPCFVYLDDDGDGYGQTGTAQQVTCGEGIPGYVGQGGDCNDDNPSVHPNATEICGNGIDDNCDGQVDEGCSCFAYLDNDGDGYGNPITAQQIPCGEMIPGYVGQGGDCNDNDPSVHPNAVETCGNGIDDNCNGQVDEGCSCFAYLDADEDGYGDPATATQITCGTMIPGCVGQGGDCNDNDPSVHPNAEEICGNGIDEDCDGQVDEKCPCFAYLDTDGDGYGDPATATPVTCGEMIPGYVGQGGDCNDNDPLVHPNAAETCGNGIDDNCDGQVDEGCSGYIYYFDGDGDGYGGDYWEPSSDPTPPSGFVTKNGDCNDYDNAIYPGAAETCNRIDDNCDGVVDEGCLKEQLPDFTKNDIYGVSHHFYGDLADGKAVVIELSTGWCPFSDVAEPQLSNVYDDICQGQSNVKLYDIVFETDMQGEDADDAFGVQYAARHNALYPIIANSRDVYNDFAYEYSLGFIPTFLVVIPDVNDPAKSAVHIIVGAIDNLKDSIENILVSNGYPITPPPSLSITVSGDICGLPAPVTLTSNQSSGITWSTGETTQSITITAGGDYWLSYAAGCGTITKKVHIAQTVVGTLSSLSGSACAGAKGAIRLTYTGGGPNATLEYSLDSNSWTTHYGAFSGSLDLANEWPAGTTVYFRVHEVVSNSTGLPTCESNSNVVQIISQQRTDDAPEITVNSEDCSFPLTLTSPNVDNNFWSTGETTQSISVNSPDYYYVVTLASCGQVYDDIFINSAPMTWYRDADGDGFGDANTPKVGCAQPNGYSWDPGDCDDTNPAINPFATEICDDGIDNDCDGQIDEGCHIYTYYFDNDGDGFGDSNFPLTIEDPTPPANYAAIEGDCRDDDPYVNPGVSEICGNGIDDNCNGLIDEGIGDGCSETHIYYFDNDGDGFGNSDLPLMTTDPTPPVSYAESGGDCNDDDPLINPGAPEVCGNGIDDNCDGNIDEECPVYTYYLDLDGDGYGVTDEFFTSTNPVAPPLFSTLDGDCNDDDASVHTTETWYLDADNDGHYVNSTNSCGSPGTGYNTTSGIKGDCNDSDPNTWVSGLAYKDQDLDGYTVGSPITVCYGSVFLPGYSLTSLGEDCNDNDNAKWRSASLYVDADGDGYTVGAASSICYGATIPTGYVATSLGTDCNDANASLHAALMWYLDADNDGHYVSSQSSCGSPGTGYNTSATQSGDCNDNDNTKWQSALLYVDADGDGYTVGAATSVCYGATIPAGYKATSSGNDCNDNNAAVHPGATEICDGIDNNCNGTIDEGCATVTVSIADTFMNEGNKNKSNMVFNVTLSKAFTKKVTVQYATQNGTATAGSDYVAKSGSLTFNAGSTKQTISISVNGDKTVESNETFNVLLSSPVNAAIAKGTATGIIRNDDGNAIAGVVSSVEAAATHSAKIWPTPANSNLWIELSGYTGNVTVQLISMQGRTLLQKKIQAVTKFAKEQINVSGFASGSYVLAIIDDKGNMKTEKVIISH